MVSVISNTVHRLQQVVPQTAHVPGPGFELAVPSESAFSWSPFRTVFKCVHIVHFFFRRMEQVRNLQNDPYAVFMGAGLMRLDSVPLVQFAVKAAQIGRILFDIKDMLARCHQACRRFVQELRCELPVPHEFFKEEIQHRDFTQVIPWHVEVSKKLKQPFANMVHRVRWIMLRLSELIRELVTLSRNLLDLYDAVVYSSSSWEYFQLLPNLTSLLQRLEDEPQAFASFVKKNEEVFYKACQLLHLEGLSGKIIHCLESAAAVLRDTARGIRTAARAARQGVQDVGNVGQVVGLG